MPKTSTAATPVVYSCEPASNIDVLALSASRFLVPDERRLPYRDASGRININLLDASLRQLDGETRWPYEGGREVLRKRITAWQRAATKAIAARPADENMTLDQLFGPLPGQAPAAASPTKLPSAPAAGLMRTPVPASSAENHATVSSSPAPPLDGLEKPRPQHPETVAMRRRLFRKPRPMDEPLFEHDPDALEADLPHLARIAAARAGSSRAHVKRSPAASPAKKARRSGPVVTTRARRNARTDLFDESDDDEEAGAIDGEGSEAGSSSDLAGGDSSDVYEVEAVLEEDESGHGRGFLIRWAGYGPDDDSWEPEEHVAPELIEAFRRERALVRSNRGDDYLLGRTRMLWCGPCAAHHPADNFSATQRRCQPSCRTCLSHHYRTQAAAHVSLLTGASHETPARAALKATPSSTKKRKARHLDACSSDESDSDGEAAADDEQVVSEARRRAAQHLVERRRAPPDAPRKAPRPIARALSHRQAAIEAANLRPFGFGYL